MTPPGASDLRALIIALSGNDRIHIDIRNECHLLMIAIDRNDLPSIAEHVRTISRLADEHSLVLPEGFRDDSRSAK
jgi:hypothetical protein